MSDTSTEELLSHVDNIWSILRNRVAAGSSSSKKRRTGFFRSSTTSPLDLMQQEEIKDEHISIMVNLERRLFNFMSQWINIVLQMNIENPNLDDILSPLIGFVQSHCDSEKAKVLIDAVNEAKEQGPPRLVSFSPAEISTELVPPGERYVKSTAYP